ncbi:MAG: response regulator [Planctomycetes bacterium]|nr:response regulator [Planctomycetota bacterium]
MMTKRILIVDDEEGYRRVLLNSLTDSGYETKAVKNGLEALEEIKRQRYSIILLDVKIAGCEDAGNGRHRIVRADTRDTIFFSFPHSDYYSLYRPGYCKGGS